MVGKNRIVDPMPWSRPRTRSKASAKSAGRLERLELKADIDGGRRMRERADRHIVGAGRCKLRDSLQSHAAGDFDLRTSAREAHGFANLVGCHVVEQDERRPGCKRL